jgi:hypothetical protein
VLTGLFTGAGRGRPVRLPVFPLGTVLYPAAVAVARVRGALHGHGQGLHQGRPRVRHLLDAYATVGTIAKIVSWDMPQLGILNLVTEAARCSTQPAARSRRRPALAEVTLLQCRCAGGPGRAV